MKKKKLRNEDDFDDVRERGASDKHKRHITEKRFNRALRMKNVRALLDLEESDYL